MHVYRTANTKFCITGNWSSGHELRSFESQAASCYKLGSMPVWWGCEYGGDLLLPVLRMSRAAAPQVRMGNFTASTKLSRTSSPPNSVFMEPVVSGMPKMLSSDFSFLSCNTLVGFSMWCFRLFLVFSLMPVLFFDLTGSIYHTSLIQIWISSGLLFPQLI